MADLAANKLRWATTHGYGFEFIVTNSLGALLGDFGLRHWEFSKVNDLLKAQPKYRPSLWWPLHTRPKHAR